MEAAKRLASIEANLKQQATQFGLTYLGHDDEYYNFIWPCKDDTERPFRIPKCEIEILGPEGYIQNCVGAEKLAEVIADVYTVSGN